MALRLAAIRAMQCWAKNGYLIRFFKTKNNKMEIKFRGQKIDSKEWVYGNLVKTENGQCFIFNFHFIPALSCPSDKFIEVKPESIGQLWNPSLRIEFYTGDLLTAICSPSGSNVKKERLCKVGFSGNGMQISVWHKKEWWLYQSMDYTSIKVVGNTTDNTDLLGW